MYDRKIFLYFALIIVGFLLWNAWQKDYGIKPQPVATSQGQLPTGVSATTTSQTISLAPVPQDRIIQVKTDTLEIKIDKLGGNIISLKLPKYPVSYKTPQLPETLLTENSAKYYAAQSAIVSPSGTDSAQIRFNSPQAIYTLEPSHKELKVVLIGQNKDQTIQKTYLFRRGRYEVGVYYTITNHSDQPWVGSLVAQISRRGLSDDNSMFGLHTYSGAAISSPQTPYEKVSYSKMDKENLDRMIKSGWLAMQQRYFVSAWVQRDNDTLHYYTRTQSVGESNKPIDRVYTIGFQTPEITIPAKGTKRLGATFYSGPTVADYLKQVAPHLDLVIDYGWLWIFSVPIFKIMQTIYYFVHNWGVAIILVTVLIKLLFYKLSEASYRSMARMRNLQPSLLALKERYGDDRQKLSQATMEFYKKEKVNPLGGCLPMIVQIPVFIALYYVLIESVELRQAPFVFWIHDLSMKDPYYVLPILMGLSWMWQQALNPPPPDPVQAKVMQFFPIVFTILFATFPAGLVLYWIVNNCLSVLQQWYIMRKVENEGKKKQKPKTITSRASSSR
jgi:YidC/Oxa1 family membrane protein insertase